MDSVQGKGLILNVLGPGEFFGEIALLDGKGRTATAVVRDARDLLFTARMRIHVLLRAKARKQCPASSSFCARRPRRSTEYIADTAFLDLSTRLAKAAGQPGA